MQKVTIIELNGNAFHVDEGAYGQLHDYLERAAAKLAADPDKAEIMADLEQAIAEKLRKFLGPNKNVVSAAEVAQVVAEMGPVESNASADPTAAAGASAGTPGGPQPAQDSTAASAHKRLYQIREGAWISGVCNGIAAYFGIDVTLVRVVFVALTILTVGAWALAYIAMMFVIPYAQTSEEHAAAHGLPFTAQKLFEQAKMQHEHFSSKEWRRQWRRQRRQWRAWQRHWRHGFWYPSGSYGAAAPPPPPAGYAGQVVAGVLLPLLGIVGAVLGVAFVLAVLSLLFTGGILGWFAPPDVPRWTAIVALALLYGLIMWPLHAARRGAYYAATGDHDRWFAASSGTFSLIWMILILWLAYHYLPGVREFLHSLPHAVGELLRQWHQGTQPAPTV